MLNNQPLSISDTVWALGVLVAGSFPVFLILNIAIAFTLYQSLLENASTTFFLAPFAAFLVRCLFLLTTMVLLREPQGCVSFKFQFKIFGQVIL